MKVDAQLLWQAVKNATLFCRDKTWNGGEAMIDITSGVLSVVSSNDFVTVVSQVPGVVASGSYFVPHKELKEVEKGLREAEGEIDFQLHNTAPSEPQWWEDLRGIIALLGKNPKLVGPWELNPEHLTLLSRLEPKGKYPLSLQAFTVGESDGWLWGMKYGPSVYGIVVPLQRNDLKMSDEDKAVALW